MDFNKIIIFFSLIFSSYSIERRHHCSSITCGIDCNGDCGWSSFWNRCLQGYTTSQSELNLGSGCTSTTISTITFTTTSPTSTLTTTTSPTSTLTTTTSPTSTLTTTTSPTSTLTSTETSTFSTQFTTTIFSIAENELDSSYTYIPAILASILFITIIFFIYKKRRQRRRNLVILNNSEIKNKLYNEHLTYNEDNVFDTIYEEPINSITPYLVSQDTTASYEEPINEEEMYEEVGNEYEYDNRVLQNKNYEN